LPLLVQVGACADELRLMGGGRGSTLAEVFFEGRDSASEARNVSSAWAPSATKRMWREPYGEGAYWTVHRAVSGGCRRARLCAWARRFVDTKGWSEWEGKVSSQACNRQNLKAQAVLFQCIAKSARFRFPVDREFFDPCGSAAELDTFGLGTGQYMVYGRRVAAGVATPKWFHSNVDISFVARPTWRDVERSFCRACGTPLVMGS